jgi:hypothetical protein
MEMYMIETLITYLVHHFGSLEKAAHFFSVINSVVVVITLVVLLFQVRMAKQKEALDREYGTFIILSTEWEKFLSYCGDNLDLDIYDVSDEEIKSIAAVGAIQLEGNELKRKLIGYSKLVSLMEVAYLMYSKQDTKIKRDQWLGWDQYIKMHFKRDEFALFYPIVSGAFSNEGGFSKDFESYMQSIAASHRPKL